jgi:Mrp family chromosome partitioning ATPase
VIIGVTSGKGGPGATVLAVNLAFELSQRDRDCLLVDLDPWGGDVGAYLDPERVDPRRGLLPLLKLERSAISEGAVERECQGITDHLSVLLGLIRPEPDLLRGRIQSLLRSARRVAEIVVVDLGRIVASSPSLEALPVTDCSQLAARPDLQGALAAERALALITGNTAVVATHVRRRSAADVVELSDALGRQVVASIPYLRDPLPRRRTKRLRREISKLIDSMPAREEVSDVLRQVPQEIAVS